MSPLETPPWMQSPSTPSSADDAVDDLLPPSATGGNVDSLLPPGADSPTPAQPTGHATAPAPQAPKSPEGMVLIPTEDGGFVAVDETVKVIHTGDEDVEVRRLSTEEKEERRGRRSIIVFAICLVMLLATLLIIGWATGVFT